MRSGDVARDTLVVTGSGEDEWMKRVRCVLEDEEPASTEEEVSRAMTVLLARYPSVNSIELVSHSMSSPPAHRNQLVLGEWIATADALLRVLREPVARLGPNGAVRLFGCDTACGSVARATLQQIESQLGVTAWGTTRIVNSDDLTPLGSKRWRYGLFVRPSNVKRTSEYAVTNGTMQRAGAKAFQFEPRHREAIVAGIAERSGEHVDEILSLFRPSQAYRYPGMLTLPNGRLPLYGAKHPAEVIGYVDLVLQEQVLRITRLDREVPDEYLFLLPRENRREVAERIPLWGGRIP